MKLQSERRFWIDLLVIAVLAVGLAPVVHAKVSDPEKLVSFLKVQLPGWVVKDGFPRFERVNNRGKSYVEAQVIYASENSTITAVIMEGEIAEQVADVRGFKLAESERGYVRKTTVQGFEATEIYNNAEKQGYLFIFVAENCLIPIEAKEVGGTKILGDLANKLDLPALTAMVK